jgi:hypothetical protein
MSSPMSSPMTSMATGAPAARLWRRGAVLGVLMAALVACTAAPPAVVTPEPEGDAVYGGFLIDPPAPDEVVLTLEGARTVELTMAELDGLALQEVTFVEPFVKVEQRFRVVALADLLELAGIGPGDTVDTIALNDYRYRDEVSALLAADALLAVARDGEAIPMDAGGPIRLVFASDSSYHGFLDAWNWSLRSIRVVAGS